MQSRRTGLSISRIRSAVNMTAPLMIETIVNSLSPKVFLSSRPRPRTRSLIWASVNITLSRSRYSFVAGVRLGMGSGPERQTPGPDANRYRARARFWLGPGADRGPPAQGSAARPGLLMKATRSAMS